MRVLVSGGAGYIGSVVAAELLKQNYQVIVVDNFVTGHRSHVSKQADLIECDLSDRDRLFKLLDGKKFDAVMHFASATLVGESVEKPFKYLRDNVVAAQNLLEFCIDHKVNKFVFSSTANLFEAQGENKISENSEIKPGSPYGESKYLIERTLATLNKFHGLNYACLRYFNACGATEELGEDHEAESHLIPLILDVALGRRDKIKVFGNDYPTADGTCVRDYVHVLDLASAHISALKKIENCSVKYNLGNGNGFSVLQVINAVAEVTGKKIPYEFVARRAGDPAYLVADSTAAKSELNWKPKYTNLNDIISTAWAWHSRRFS